MQKVICLYQEYSQEYSRNRKETENHTFNYLWDGISQDKYLVNSDFQINNKGHFHLSQALSVFKCSNNQTKYFKGKNHQHFLGLTHFKRGEYCRIWTKTSMKTKSPLHWWGYGTDKAPTVSGNSGISLKKKMISRPRNIVKFSDSVKNPGKYRESRKNSHSNPLCMIWRLLYYLSGTDFLSGDRNNPLHVPVLKVILYFRVSQ